MKKFDILVFIGRFQPLHKGHEEVIREALRNAQAVIVLVGSANRASSPRNPWTYEQRLTHLRAVFHWEMSREVRTLFVEPLDDHVYNDVGWMTQVRDTVHDVVQEHSDLFAFQFKPNIGLIGYAKDHTSYYLKMFPEWGSYDLGTQFALFNSTDIRHNYFRSGPILPDRICSDKVVDLLEAFMYTETFKLLVEEQNFNKQYKKIWSSTPFPPTFQTVDAVVVQSGHVLLVERRDCPGRGLLALPGGYVEQNETLINAVVRELKEETQISDGKSKIGMPSPVLRSYITKHEAFDDPHRSERGRVITMAYLFKMPDRQELFRVKGDDDALSAKWYPISSISGTKLFEDHFFIMSKMLGITI